MKVYDSVVSIFSIVTGIIFCNAAVLRRESSNLTSTTDTAENGNQIKIQSPQDFHRDNSTAVLCSLEESTDLNEVKDSPLTNKNSNDGRTDYPKRTCQNYKSEKSKFQRVNDEVICPATGEALFPDRSDCNQFWQCSNGYKYQMKCSPHLWFNSDSNICDYVWNHPLKQACADARCPKGSTDLLSLYGDCTKYIECSDGYAHVLSCCPHNKNANCSNCFFDDVNKQCLVKYASGTIE